MQPRRWLSISQTMALANLRFVACLWHWRAVKVDPSDAWDGIVDTGFEVAIVNGQFDLFAHERQLAACARRVAA
jgi:hypothetical protein